jgi:hypothetical protein
MQRHQLDMNSIQILDTFIAFGWALVRKQIRVRLNRLSNPPAIGAYEKINSTVDQSDKLN